MGMIKRNAILINGGSAAEVDRASTAAAVLVDWLSPPNAERAEVLTPNSEAFAVRIPATMPLVSAAPLKCGDPVHSPTRGAGKRMAIIGFGGLGHVGVQIATVMGASTTVINHMEQQMDDASRFAGERSRKGRPT